MSFHFLGGFLLEQGLVTQQQIDEAAAFQAGANLRLGAYAVGAGLLTQEQVDVVLGLQRETDLNFGELAVLKGFVSKPDMQALLFRQQVNQVHLGEALLQLGHLTFEQFGAVLRMYATRENTLRSRLTKLYSHRCGCDLLAVLIAAVERAFLRFAQCPLKAQGKLSEDELAQLSLGCSSGVPVGNDATLHFTLHLGAEMLSILSRSASEEDLPDTEAQEAAQEMAEVVCRYLREAVGASSGGTGPCSHAAADQASGIDCLRLKLACPKAAIGLTVGLLTRQHAPSRPC